MKIAKITQFFNEVYTASTDEPMAFETKYSKNKHTIVNLSKRRESMKLDQLVSPLTSQEKAQEIATSLKKILPQCADVGVVQSRRSPDNFRAIIYNPLDVYADYAQKIVDKLNTENPHPGLSKQSELCQWHVSRVNNTVDVAWASPISRGYSWNFITSSKAKQSNQVTYEYNKRIESAYPGIKIDIEEHKGGDVYLLEQIPYATFFAKNDHNQKHDDVAQESTNLSM
jgi:hypothetical protein